MAEPKIQASDVQVGNRTLEAVLLELALEALAGAEQLARAVPGDRVHRDAVVTVLRDVVIGLAHEVFRRDGQRRKAS